MTKLANRVISVFDHKTSMRLAVPEWTAVDDICKQECIKRKKLFELIAQNKDPNIGFTCSVRLFAITYMHNLMLNGNITLKKEKNDYKNIYHAIELMS